MKKHFSIGDSCKNIFIIGRHVDEGNKHRSTARQCVPLTLETENTTHCRAVLRMLYFKCVHNDYPAVSGRMAHRLLQFLIPIFLSLLICGCSGSSNPTFPSNTNTDNLHAENNLCSGAMSNRHLWGIWEVSVSDDHLSATAVPVRSAGMHLNAVGFLEDDPCTYCLSISNLVPYPDNRLSVDLTLIHPFPGNPKLTGFDVRGVFVTDADYHFPECGRYIAWDGNIPRLLLPNGYTTLFNPLEYDYNQPGAKIFKYIPGKLAADGVLDSTLNGYVAYRREAPRRMFESGGSETRTVWLGVPDGGFKFGYAVDCCWQKVDGQVTDPVEDFPPDANCLEAFRVDVQLGSNLEPVAGTTQPIEVQVFDHQGLDTISAVILEAPELFAGEVKLDYIEDVGIKTHMFMGTVENEFGVGAGEYPMLVRVIDTEEDQNLGQIDAWFLYRVEVGARNGWVRTWGADAYIMGVSDYARAVAVDDNGYIYVVGQFRKTVDLDPGDGVDEHTAIKGGAYLSKFNTDGDFIWTRTWDSPGTDSAFDLVVDSNGNILVLGSFSDFIDLDPGPGTDLHEGKKSLSKFDPNGNYLWGISWNLFLIYYRLTVDGSDNVYIGGYFYGQTDFDPGEGEDLRWPNGKQDACLTKIGPNGEYIWSRTWGGPGNTFADNDRATAVAADIGGYVYVAGYVSNTTDFDPGAEVEEHEPGRFLSKFAPTGKFLGVNVWDAGYTSLAVDMDGNLYVTGKISNNVTVDFDLGAGVDERHGPCAYLASYSSTGDYHWGRTWGFGLAHPTDLTVASNGEIYIAGEFHWNLVDFDPTDNTDYHESLGGLDVYLSKYLPNGEYQWTRTWGGDDYEYGNGVAADGSGNAFVAGKFTQLVDFDPGPGWEYRVGHGGGDAYLIKIPPDGNW